MRVQDNLTLRYPYRQSTFQVRNFRLHMLRPFPCYSLLGKCQTSSFNVAATGNRVLALGLNEFVCLSCFVFIHINMYIYIHAFM